MTPAPPRRRYAYRPRGVPSVVELAPGQTVPAGYTLVVEEGWPEWRPVEDFGIRIADFGIPKPAGEEPWR